MASYTKTVNQRDYKTMSYKSVIENKSVKVNNNVNVNPKRINFNTLPKGWLLIKNDGRKLLKMSDEEYNYIENTQEQQRQQLLVEENINRFIEHKRVELIKENFNDEDIEEALEFIMDMINENNYDVDYDSNYESGDSDSDYY
tara:strand:- start:2363 stop:2791 length:429 start_codon:yes stop_codon:yes gene_type:complete